MIGTWGAKVSYKSGWVGVRGPRLVMVRKCGGPRGGAKRVREEE